MMAESQPQMAGGTVESRDKRHLFPMLKPPVRRTLRVRRTERCVERKLCPLRAHVLGL